MSLFDFLFRLLGRPDPAAPVEPDYSSGPNRSVAVDEGGDSSLSDKDNASAQSPDAMSVTSDIGATRADARKYDGPETWWRPRGELIQRPLRPSGKARMIDGGLYDNLTAVLRDPELELPRMSHVAQRGLSLLNDPEVDFTRLAKILEQDPAIATEILRVANSPLYRGVSEVNRLDMAISRLGRRRLHAVVLTLSMRGLAIRSGSDSLGEQLWRRSIAAAVIVSALAARYQLPEDEAFLVGLLHDVGMLATLRVAHDYQRTHGKNVPRSLFDYIAYEWHGHVGLRLADAWNLPSPLPEIIGQHHTEPNPEDGAFRYQCLVQIADACCDLLGYGQRVPYDLFALPCCRLLGLTADSQTVELLESLPERIKERLKLF